MWVVGSKHPLELSKTAFLSGILFSPTTSVGNAEGIRLHSGGYWRARSLPTGLIIQSAPHPRMVGGDGVVEGDVWCVSLIPGEREEAKRWIIAMCLYGIKIPSVLWYHLEET